MAHAIPGVGVLDGPQSDGRLAPRGSSIVIGISQRRRGDSHHGGDHHEDLTHIGTSWSQTGDVWWWSSTSDEHHEIAFDDSLYDHNEEYYDGDENDYDQDEEESADHTGDY